MKKNIKIMALAGVAAVTVVGGTFAYYNATQTFQNPFNTNHYGTSATEKFNPGDGDDWKPGADVPKTVKATNTGTSDVWVRVSFNEIWTLEDERTIDWNSGESGFFEIPADLKASNSKYQDHDGTNEPSSVVIKHFVDENIITDKNELTPTVAATGKWYFEGGYYYYTDTLAPTDFTNELLKSVQLHKDTDMGLFVDSTYFAVVNKNDKEPEFDKSNEKLWHKVDEGQLADALKEYADQKVDIYTYKENELSSDQKLHGYANSDYELDITVDFVQATADAAEASNWTWNPSMIQPAAAEPAEP